MATSQYILNKIRDKYPIKEYLSSKGIEPKKVSGGTSCYCCPCSQHSGEDKTPSFYLFDKGCGKQARDYVNFKCFGCKTSGDIISLVASLDFHGNWGQAIKFLSEGADITFEGETNYLFQEIAKLSTGSNNSDKLDIPQISLKISHYMRMYLEQVNYDNDEIENFTEKVLKIVDKAILAMDYNSIEEIYNYMSNDGIRNRIIKYHENKRKKQIKLSEDFKKWTK